MRVLQVFLVKDIFQAQRPGQAQAVADARVVRPKTQDARHQRPVGAVAAEGLCKAAGKPNLGAHCALAQDIDGHPPNAHRARRVAAGGPDHHRADNIKNVHVRCPFLRLQAHFAFLFYTKNAVK